MILEVASYSESRMRNTYTSAANSVVTRMASALHLNLNKMKTMSRIELAGLNSIPILTSSRLDRRAGPPQARSRDLAASLKPGRICCRWLGFGATAVPDAGCEGLA